jgi:alkyl hydroperoxide reductase subunit AhpC
MLPTESLAINFTLPYSKSSTSNNEETITLSDITKQSDYTVFFAFPKANTPICTTEMLEILRLEQQFMNRRVAFVGLSLDTVHDQQQWLSDILSIANNNNNNNNSIPFTKPQNLILVSDVHGVVAQQYGMIRSSTTTTGGDEKVTNRALYIIDQSFTIVASMSYPIKTGRSFDEILRLVDSLRLTKVQSTVGTPANWKNLPHDRVVILPGNLNYNNNHHTTHSNSTVHNSELPYLRFTTFDALVPLFSTGNMMTKNITSKSNSMVAAAANTATV